MARITFTLPPSLAEHVAREARQRGTTRAVLAREAPGGPPPGD